MDEDLIFDASCALEPGTCLLEGAGSGGKLSVRRRDDNLVVFVLRGGVVIDLGSSTIELGPGTALIAEGAACSNLDVRSDTQYYLLWFRGRTGGERPELALELPVVYSVRRPDRLVYHLRRYLILSKGDHWHVQMCGLLMLILRELALSEISVDGSRRQTKVASSIASRIDAYIAAHFREQIGTPDIAAELHYNPEYLERAYRQLRHLSIRDAIHLRRLREAGAQLLLHRDRCISDIAEMCGYRDSNYFRRAFKRKMKMTPNRYRFIHTAARRAGGRRKGVDASA